MAKRIKDELACKLVDFIKSYVPLTAEESKARRYCWDNSKGQLSRIIESKYTIALERMNNEVTKHYNINEFDNQASSVQRQSENTNGQLPSSERDTNISNESVISEPDSEEVHDFDELHTEVREIFDDFREIIDAQRETHREFRETSTAIGETHREFRETSTAIGETYRAIEESDREIREANREIRESVRGIVGCVGDIVGGLLDSAEANQEDLPRAIEQETIEVESIEDYDEEQAAIDEAKAEEVLELYLTRPSISARYTFTVFINQPARELTEYQKELAMAMYNAYQEDKPTVHDEEMADAIVKTYLGSNLRKSISLREYMTNYCDEFTELQKTMAIDVYKEYQVYEEAKEKEQGSILNDLYNDFGKDGVYF